MNKEVKDILNQRRKLFILEYAKALGSVTKACQEFGIPRSSFYDWEKAYDTEGQSGFLDWWLNTASGQYNLKWNE